MGCIRVPIFVIALSLFALAISSIGRAWASPPAQSDNRVAQNDEKELVRQGSELFLRQDYEGARVALGRAYALNPTADTVLKLGIAELQSNHPVQAVIHLREYLTHVEEPVAKLEIVKTKWLPRAEAATARLDVFAPLGAQVLVDGVVQERPAFSTLDEVKAGKPSISIVISAGDHEVIARQGTAVESKQIVARGGELVELHFQRVPDAAGPSTQVGSAPAVQENAVPTDSSKSRWRLITTIALGSLAVAASGVAIGFSIAFQQNKSKADDLRSQIGTGMCGTPVPATRCPDLREVDQAQQRNGSLANGFYATGGGAAVFAAATWLLWPKGQTSNRAIRALLIVSQKSSGLVLSGAW